MTKNNKDPVLDEPNKLSRKSLLPGPADPRRPSRSKSPTRVDTANQKPSKIFVSKRGRASALEPKVRHTSGLFAVTHHTLQRKLPSKAAVPSHTYRDTYSRQGSTDTKESGPVCILLVMVNHS